MAAEPRRLLTHEEYFALEEATGQRHEYVAGQVYAMVGGSFAHGQICINTSTTLSNQLDARPCIVQGSDCRISIARLDIYAYPDVSVVCGEPQFDQANAGLLNPIVLIEVLSPSTATYDEGGKFLRYQQIASLRDYILIEQKTPLVKCISRDDEGRWLWTAAEGLDATLVVPSIGCELALSRIYRKVSFAEEATGN